ncbi:MAG: hypothetical protein WD200_02445 [Candidatus Andersenbacteria bacterium]
MAWTKNNYALLGIAAVILLGAVLYLRGGQEAPQLEVLYDKVPYDISITSDTFTPAVGQTVKMGFEVKLNGQPIDLAAQEIYPHASVVSNDLGDVWFYHIDELENPATGVYEFEHTFAQTSDYTVWIEVNNNQTPDHHEADSDYIARFAIDVQGAQAFPAVVTSYSETFAVNFVPGERYKLKVPPYNLQAGQPGTFSVMAEKADGSAVPLLPDFDHFYILASPEHDNFYTLEHPQFNKLGETQVITKSVIFPAPGKYAFWVRLFPDDGSGTVTDAIEGPLVLEVK